MRRRLDDPAETLVFSAVSLWEIAGWAAARRNSGRLDPGRLRAACLAAGYVELPLTGLHALEVARLPPRPDDPFGRMLIAQARLERLTLLTAGPRVAGCGRDLGSTLRVPRLS